jgi:hypothetical protein
MNPAQRMLIEHECRKLMVAYARCLDRGDAEGFANLYTEDAMYKPAINPEPIYGRQAILQWAYAYPKGRLTCHISTNEFVEVVDETHATGSAYCVTFREPIPRPDAVSDAVTPRAVVEYFDTFLRTDEGWRFASRYYQMRFMQPSETNRPLPWNPAMA